jgi:hypothetical protein
VRCRGVDGGSVLSRCVRGSGGGVSEGGVSDREGKCEGTRRPPPRPPCRRRRRRSEDIRGVMVVLFDGAVLCRTPSLVALKKPRPRERENCPCPTRPSAQAPRTTRFASPRRCSCRRLHRALGVLRLQATARCPAQVCCWHAIMCPLSFETASFPLLSFGLPLSPTSLLTPAAPPPLLARSSLFLLPHPLAAPALPRSHRPG